MKTILLLLITCVMVFGIGASSHALVVDTGVTSTDMVNALLGPDISLVAGSISDGQAGTAGGLFSDGVVSGLGIDSGIIMSTGLAADADGPNTTGTTTTYGPETLGGGGTWDDTSTNLHLGGDTDLTDATGVPTVDANVLEFKFETATGDLFFNYIFASEEYIDWVNSSFNDVFGFFVDGANIGLVPGTTDPVTVNSINPNTNSAFYINNVTNTNGYPVAGADIAYDGFTTVLAAQALGIGSGEHTMKLVIADGSDAFLDAAVFIQSGSFSGEPTQPVPEPATMFLLSSGLVGLAAFRRRFRKS
jgi:hypothetical protein